jgi:hypothetical protein
MAGQEIAGPIELIIITKLGRRFMNNTRISNALIYDKSNIGLNEDIRQSLKIFHKRNIYIDIVKLPSLVTIAETEDDAIKETAESHNNYDYLILTWEGTIPNIYYYHEACIKHVNDLNEKTNGNWLVSGQIMDQCENRKMFNDPEADKWKGSFYLFPITAIVNLKKWRELDCPDWGQQQLTPIEHIVPNRGTENIHDNYTPLVINPNTTLSNTPVKKGWNIIDVSLKNNMSVYNLSNEIRQSQTYMYPENNPKMFNDFWHSLYMMPKLSDQYLKVLQTVMPAKTPIRIDTVTWGCFIRNTEDYIVERFTDVFYNNMGAVDTLMLPCSGFKDVIIYSKKPKDVAIKQVVHFDIIKGCVDIRKQIVEEWDGTRSHFTILLDSIKLHYQEKFKHPNCFHMSSMNTFDDAYLDILKNFNSEEELERTWLEFKKLKHVFIHADILAEPWMVTKQIKDSNVYLCLSDIAGWRSNVIAYGYKTLRNQLGSVAKHLQKNNCQGIVDYKDPGTDLQLLQEFNEFLTHLATDVV